MYIRTKEKGDLPELPELSRHLGIRTEKKKTHTRVSLHI